MDPSTWPHQARFWAREYRRRFIIWSVNRLSPDTGLQVQQALELRSAPPSSPCDWQAPLFRSIVVDSSVVAPSTSISIDVTDPAPSVDGHFWPDVRVHRVKGVVIDRVTGLVFAGRHVLEPSAHGGRSARLLAFVSGSGLRLSAAGARPVIDGPVAPIGPVTNYFHFLTDTAPRMLAVSQVVPDATVMRTGPGTAYSQQVFDSLGITVRSFEADIPASCDDVVLCDNWPMAWPHPAMLTAFRDAVLSSIPEVTHRIPALYVSRAATTRALDGEADLEHEVSTWGVTAARLEDLPFLEQVRLVRSADILVAPHGAGLANLMFMRPGTRVIELTTGQWWSPCFRNLCAMLAIEHELVVLPRSPEHPHGSAADARDVVRRAIAGEPASPQR